MSAISAEADGLHDEDEGAYERLVYVMADLLDARDDLAGVER